MLSEEEEEEEEAEEVPLPAAQPTKKVSMEVAADHSDEGPYVGARIEVLFDVDGKQDWYGGKITSKEKQAGRWLVRLDDGDEETIVWPDPQGEVRIVSAKKERRDDKEECKTDTGSKGNKAGRPSKMVHLRTGDLCRVLFMMESSTLEW
jgi:hypothetical protein